MRSDMQIMRKQKFNKGRIDRGFKEESRESKKKVGNVKRRDYLHMKRAIY